MQPPREVYQHESHLVINLVIKHPGYQAIKDKSRNHLVN